MDDAYAGPAGPSGETDGEALLGVRWLLLALGLLLGCGVAAWLLMHRERRTWSSRLAGAARDTAGAVADRASSLADVARHGAAQAAGAIGGVAEATVGQASRAAAIGGRTVSEAAERARDAS